FPDIFDGNLLVKDETLPLVGLRFSPEDTEIQRIFLGDIHQGHRPYDLDHDISNFSLQRKVDDREWLSSLEELSQIGVMRMQYGHANYNEIIGRVRWDFTFETSHICIFHDNLETRLLAQLRAKDLLYTYRDKYPQDIPTHYQVPISFYRHLQTISKLTYYSLSEQLNDIKRAEEQTIHIDYLALLNIEDDSFCFENYNIE